MTRPIRTLLGLITAFALFAAGHAASAQARIDINQASATELTRLPGIGKVKAQRIVAYRAAHGPFHTVDELRRVKGIGKVTLARLRDRVTCGGGGTGRSDRGTYRDPPPAHDGRSPGGGDGGDYDLDLTKGGGASARTDGDGDAAAVRTRDRASDRTGGRSQGRHHARRHRKEPPTGKINVNTAGPTELQKLPGIGPAKARAIIAQRTSQGPFRKVDEIVKVPGIGQKTLEKLRPWITVKVDLNRADLHDLEAIGLDTASAERLLTWRHKHGRFSRVADLTRVPGFGEGALVTLRPLVWVGTP